MMKKLSTLAAALLCAAMLLLPVSAFAAEYDTDPQGNTFVETDTGDVLSEDEISELNRQAYLLSEQYGCGVYILITNDMSAYNYSDIEVFAQDLYSGTDLGYNESMDGIALVLSMEDRSYDLCDHGDYGNYVFTDYGKERLAESFLPDFSNNDWYAGCSNYLNALPEYFEAAINNEPIDTGTDKPGFLSTLLSSLLIALPVGGVFAFLRNLGLKHQLVTVAKATNADHYIAAGKSRLTARRDILVNHYMTSEPIPEHKDSGGGTTVNDEGFSHSSGHF